MRPVGDIVRDLTSLADPSIAAIENLLRTYQVVWTTKEEDARLPKIRRLDPAADYAAAGIVLSDLE